MVAAIHRLGNRAGLDELRELEMAVQRAELERRREVP